MNPKTRRSTAAPVLLALLLAASAGCGDKGEPLFLGATRITIATHNDLPGVSYEKNYHRSGFDYLFIQQIKEELGVKMTEPVNVSSQDRVTMLENEDADLVIASFSITRQRMKKVDFVGPYVSTYQGILVGKRGADIHRMSDLAGRRVCTWEGTTSVPQFKGLRFEKIVAADASDCLDALRKNRVDAVSTDQLILYGFVRRYAKDGLRVVPGIRIGAPQHYGVGMRKGHRADCERLRDFVKRYVEANDWIKDMEASLPEIPENEPGWINDYKPSAAAIDARSCRDAPSP